MATVAGGMQVMSAVIIELGDKIDIQMTRMAPAVLFGWLSTRNLKKTSPLPVLQLIQQLGLTEILSYACTLIFLTRNSS